VIELGPQRTRWLRR